MFREIALSIGLARGIGAGLTFAIVYQFAAFFGLMSYDSAHAIAFFVTGLAGWSATDLINNYFDYDIDSRALPERARIVEKYGKLFPVSGYAIGGMGIVLSFLAFGFPGLAATVLAAVASTLYSVPPLSLKRTVYKPIVNLFIAMVPWLIITLSSSFRPDFFILTLFFGLAVCALTVGEDIKDYDSDKGTCRTLPLLLGEKRLKALGILMALFSTGFALVVWLMLGLDGYYLLLTLLVNGYGYAMLLKSDTRTMRGRKDFGRMFVITGVAQLFIIVAWVQAALYL